MLRSPTVAVITTLALCITLSGLATPVVHAKPEFAVRIPNGKNVPGVEALGHVNPEGDGPNNQFGKDFDAAGRKWTTAFCEKDSDGDGQTNGQELGDPCCKWSSTSKVTLWTTGVSHPGDKSKTSNPSLWASANCSSSSASASTSNATTAGDSVSTPAPTSGVSSVQCAVALAVGAMLAVVLC